MKTKNSLVSVIIPVFNGERNLRNAINSVLNQNYHSLEIIVVNDGSTDDSAHIAHSFGDKINYYYQENRGPAGARNLGIKKSNGKYISFIDADDYWPENKIADQIQCFKKNDEIEIVQGLVKINFNRAESLNLHEEELSKDPHLLSNLGAMIILRNVFKKIGFFDEGLRYHEDSDFWLRARESGINIFVHKKIGLFYQLHDNNMTKDVKWDELGMTKILHRSILRRRKSNSGGENLPGFNLNEKMESVSSKMISVILIGNDDDNDLIKSLKSVAKQAYANIELIILNDKLEQLEETVFKEKFVKIVYINENNSKIRNINFAIKKSVGEYISFINAGSVWKNDILNTQVNELVQNLDIGFVEGYVRNIINPEREYSKEFVSNYIINISLSKDFDTLFMKKSLFQSVGYFDEQKKDVEGFDWKLRAKDIGIQSAKLSEVIVYRYIQSRGQSDNLTDFKPNLLKSIRDSIARKRNND